MAPSFFELRQQLRQHFRLGNHHHVVHDLGYLHAGDAGSGGLAQVAQAKAHPAHQVFVIKHSDNVLGTALRIVNRDARVLSFDHAHEGLVEHKVGGQRKNIRARHHHFANGDAVEFDGAMDHLFLKFRNLSELAAGGDDEFELVGRMDSTAAASGLSAEHSQNQSAGAAHKVKHRACDGEEGLHGRGNREGDLLRTLQRQGLGNQFAQDDVHVSDQGKGNRDGNAVGVDGDVGKALHEVQAADQAGDHGLANPAEGQADHGDAELNSVDDFVEMLVKALHDARADASRLNELLDAGVADAHQSKFGSG